MKTTGFDIQKVTQGGEPSIFFVNGFLSEGATQTFLWEKQLNNLYPDRAKYHVLWKSKKVDDIGIFFAGFPRRKITKFLKIRKMANLRNPWYEAMENADIAGRQLGQFLYNLAINQRYFSCNSLGECNLQSKKKFILFAHSLGTRLIYGALIYLTRRLPFPVIQEVHLLGGAVGNNPKAWEICSRAVEKKIYNYYSHRDIILKRVYKIGTRFTNNPIGSYPINTFSEKIKNIDVSHLVKGHLAYKKYMNEFIERDKFLRNF